MRRAIRRGVAVAMVSMIVLGASLPQAQAVHWYRNTGAGCSEADGALTDDPTGTTPNVTASVVIGHNTFSTGVSGFAADPLLGSPVTRIKAGESITWTWNSAHCHSVTSTDFSSGTTRIFDSGFHWPKVPPEAQRVAEGALEYPLLDETPTMSYTHTFDTPGSFGYFCVHHALIGMNALVIVDPA